MKGLKVVDVSADLAGAYCTRLLAACGAEVTRVEPPEGDPLRQVSARHEHLNAYKRGIVVDADAAGGKAVFDALLGSADVVVSSCNGDPERALAFDEELRSASPGCVHVVTSPFGLTGPYASYKGGELINWAMSGFLQITGDPDRPPVQGGGPWADYATGATAAVGALAAVRSGQGQLVDVGTMEAMAAFHQWSLVLYTHQGVVKKRASNMHAESFHPMGPVPCKDGWVAIGIAFVPQWEGMCIAIDKPELLVDDRFQNNAERFDNAEAFNAELFPRLAEIEADTLVESLQEHRVPAARVLDVSEFLADRQVGARDFWATVDVGGATGVLPSKPFRIPTADPPFRPAPAPGRDTEAILTELGYDAGEIDALLASGAVTTETVGVQS